MLNTLYNIAGGIALAVGALGASDDFDGAQLAQNAFFGPEDEIEAIDEQETSNEVVLTVNDVLEWDETASKAMEMSLTGSDELTDDEKLEITVLTGETPADVSENQTEVPHIEDNSQSEGLSEEEFYCMLEQQFNDAISMLESEEVIADSEPLVIEAVQEDLAAVELQPEDDVNAEKALEEAQTNAESKLEDAEEVAQVKEISEESFKEMEPWVVVHGLPDIPEEDMSALMDQTTKNEQPVKTEQIDVENVDVQEIPVVDSILVDVPEVEAPELDIIEEPLFDEAEAEEAEAEEVEEAKAEETEAKEAEEVEEAKAEADETEAEDAKAEETEVEDAEAEETEVEEAKAEEAEETEVEAGDDILIVEPLEIEETEAESKDEALLIPSLEIPPAVLTEEQRAKISEEVDAIVDQSDNFDSWIPRQIPVSGSVEEIQPQTKPEDDFIQNFSRKNVKESILENNGIDLK
ncbi:MAG: hypothetical protein IJG38_15030 [Thermoguttaceae bacterium]|nr:hypothetical protein [Thermoguttaceae bacterium]